MQFTSKAAIALVSLLSGTTVAAPLATHDSSSSWSVTNFETTCGENTICSYSFNVTGPILSSNSPGTNEPSFTTTCSGDDVAPNPIACQDSEISTKLDRLDSPAGYHNLIIRHFHMFSEEDTEGWFGNRTLFAGEQSDFEVPITGSGRIDPSSS